MTGGKSPRRKGDRTERAIARVLQNAGFGAERVPLSGSAGGSYVGDLTVPLMGRDLVAEVKARASGFRELYAWLEARDVLVLKADRRAPLVVLPLALAMEIARAAELFAKLGSHDPWGRGYAATAAGLTRPSASRPAPAAKP